MLNTKKLLYILPDLCYLAELLPGKKEHTYAIQSFRQINGEFIDDNEFLHNNIQKLFSKIDKEEYHLILPDFLFTNTIVNVDDDSESNIISHIKKDLLPNLNLNQETHEIEIAVLTKFKGKSKVQISAIEKELLSPIRVAAKTAKVKIATISPLSWTIKSIVSLEPSITVLQIGNNLYSAQHYIGVDQTNNFPVDEFSSITETIKTLKGAEPSIQTIYLISNSLVEENLKDDLSNTLPIQQLATYKEEDSKMPSYIKYIIESCMKTLSISDFPVPRFHLGKVTKKEEEAASTISTITSTDNKESSKTTQKNEIETKNTEVETSSKDPANTDLPEPTTVPNVKVLAKVEEISSMTKKPVNEEQKESNLPEPTKEITSTKIEDESVKAEEDKKEKTKTKQVKEDASEIKNKSTETEKESTEIKKNTTEKEDEAIKTESINKEEIDLSQFAGKEKDNQNDNDNDNKNDKKITTKQESQENKNQKEKESASHTIIKNSSGVNNMLKMIFITLAVFFVTIAIGIGVGLGLLKISDKNSSKEANPVAVVEPEASPEATTTPTPEPEKINKEKLSILVVNATIKAGFAGKIKTLLVNDDITNVTASNAKDEYEAGTDYVLMKDENTALAKLLSETTNLELKYDSNIKIEDPDNKYDAIIVLAK